MRAASVFEKLGTLEQKQGQHSGDGKSTSVRQQLLRCFDKTFVSGAFREAETRRFIWGNCGVVPGMQQASASWDHGPAFQEWHRIHSTVCQDVLEGERPADCHNNPFQRVVPCNCKGWPESWLRSFFSSKLVAPNPQHSGVGSRWQLTFTWWSCAQEPGSMLACCRLRASGCNGPKLRHCARTRSSCARHIMSQNAASFHRRLAKIRGIGRHLNPSMGSYCKEIKWPE